MNNIIELKKFKEKKLNSPDDNEKCNNNYKAEKKF